MRLAGFLLMPAGWIIVVAAVILLPAAASRNIFVLAGIGIEMLGLIIALRSHAVLRGDEG
jgi:hypothetical protein